MPNFTQIGQAVWISIRYEQIYIFCALYIRLSTSKKFILMRNANIFIQLECRKRFITLTPYLYLPSTANSTIKKGLRQ